MTVSNQTNRTSAVGAGAVLAIPYSFPTTASGDLLVIQRVISTGVETTLAETTSYTATYSSTGGTVTTVNSIASTDQVHVIRNTAMTQTLDLEQGGSFNAENIETALDKNTKLIIENSDSAGRSLVYPKTDPTSSIDDLPSSIDRASKQLGFDSAGKPSAIEAVPTGSVSFSAIGINIAEAADEEAVRTLIGLPLLYMDDYTDFADAISTIGAAVATLVISGSEGVSTDETVPATLTLRFERGGELDITTSKTVTINGLVEAGLYQIFDGAGAVQFGALALPEVFPEWWGAVGDTDGTTGNGTDDKTALIACVDAMASGITMRLTRFYRTTGDNGDLMSMSSGTNVVGNGFETGIYHDATAAFGSYPSLFWCLDNVENIRFADFYVKGRQDNASNGTNSGTAIMIRSESVATFALAPHDIICENLKFNDGYQAISVQAVDLDTKSPWNITIRDIFVEDHEHPIHLSGLRGSGVIVDGIHLNGTGRMQRGIGVWYCNNINISNVTAQGAQIVANVVGIFGHDDHLATANINISNVTMNSDCDAPQMIYVNADDDTVGATADPLISNVNISNITTNTNSANTMTVSVRGDATGNIKAVNISNVTSTVETVAETIFCEFIEQLNISNCVGTHCIVSDSESVTISGNVFEHTSLDPLSVFRVDDCVITGNTLLNPAVSSVGALLIGATSAGANTNIVVSGNVMRAASVTNVPVGVRINGNGTVDGLIVTGNIFDNQVSIIDLAGGVTVTNITYRDNVCLGAGDNVIATTSGTWSTAGDILVRTTTPYTLESGDNGKTISNEGDGDTLVINMPAALVGMEFRFVVKAAFAIQIDPNGSETIALANGTQQAAGKYITADAVGETCRLKCVKAGEWEHWDSVGTWTAEA